MQVPVVSLSTPTDNSDGGGWRKGEGSGKTRYYLGRVVLHPYQRINLNIVRFAR